MSLDASRLEYAHAFDLIASRLGARGDGTLLAVVSTPEFVDLAVARTWYAWRGVTLLCEDAATLAHAQHRLADGHLPEPLAAHSTARLAADAFRDAAPASFSQALWAAPQTTTWRERLATLARAVTTEGALCIVGATPLGGALRPLRRAQRTGEPIPLPHALRRALTHDRWRPAGADQLGGAATIWWTVLRRAAELARRPDLADLAERAHHRAVASDRGASFALLTLRRTPDGGGT